MGPARTVAVSTAVGTAGRRDFDWAAMLMTVVVWNRRTVSSYARRLTKAALRVARQNPCHLLQVPPITAMRARVSGALRPTVAPLAEAVAQRVGPRVSVHQDLISYPLLPGRERE